MAHALHLPLAVERCKGVLEKLGICEASSKADGLGRLLAECGAPSCDPHHILLHLDRCVVAEQNLERSLLHLNRISNDSSALFARTEELRFKLTAYPPNVALGSLIFQGSERISRVGPSGLRARNQGARLGGQGCWEETR